MKERELTSYFNEQLLRIFQFKTPTPLSKEGVGSIELLEEGETKQLFLTINALIQHFVETEDFVRKLTEGNLRVEPPIRNPLISPLKQLHATLMHLVWHIEQVSKGDYTQNVDFLGEFSLHFNNLVESIKENENRLKQQAEELTKLNSDKNRFFQILAHDLRNPFTILLGFSDILLSNFRDFSQDEIEEQLTTLKRTTQSTYNLLNDLLLWARSQSGNLPFQPEEVDIVTLCKEVVKDKRDKFNLKSISILCDQSVVGKIKLTVDQNMIKTVLRNLLSNAIKFSYRGGTVCISLQQEGESIVVSVRDSGVGIDKQEQELLWDYSKAFVKKGTEGEDGNGLGLILCKEFIDLHGGKIWVESESGEGAHFKFSIPLNFKSVVTVES